MEGLKSNTDTLVKEVKSEDDWRLQMLDAAIEDISRCEFVAIDLEFSGLFRNAPRQQTLTKHFEECARAAHEFMTVQLGICPVWRQSEYNETAGENDHNTWCFAPYNFHVFPKSERHFFASDSASLHWLYDNGFSFQEWISKGFDFIRLANLQHMFSPKHPQRGVDMVKLQQKGLQRVIDSIIKFQKPIVMHYGFMDMLHLHDKFIASIPADINEFCYDWLQLFTKGTFDTKWIASSCRYTLFQISSNKGTALSELRQHLIQMDMYRSKIHVVQRLSETANTGEQIRLTSLYSLNPKSLEKNTKYHEAGFDAMMTAQIFLMENELYHAKMNNKSDETTPCIPFDWQTTSFGQQFGNILEMKLSPGKLKLEDYSKSYLENLKEQPDSSKEYVTQESENETELRVKKPRLETNDSNEKTNQRTGVEVPRYFAKSQSQDFTFISHQLRKVYPNLQLRNAPPPSSSWAAPLRELMLQYNREKNNDC